MIYICLVDTGGTELDVILGFTYIWYYLDLYKVQSTKKCPSFFRISQETHAH